MSFAYGKNSGLFGTNSDVRGYAVPLEVNYLLGSQKNNLELGLGASVGVYNIHETTLEAVNGPVSSLTTEQKKHAISEIHIGNSTQTLLSYRESRNAFGYFLFGNIGYRHVSNKGFLLRAGLTPAFTFDDDNTNKRLMVHPYLGFGWAF